MRRGRPASRPRTCRPTTTERECACTDACSDIRRTPSRPPAPCKPSTPASCSFSLPDWQRCWSGWPKAASRWRAHWEHPLLATVMSPVKAAALLLPIFIVSDWFGLYAYRREFDKRNLLILIPAGIVGIGIGWLSSSVVSDRMVGTVDRRDRDRVLPERLAPEEPSTAPPGLPTFRAACSGVRLPASPASSPTPAVRHTRCTCCRSSCPRPCSRAHRR